MIFVYQNHLKVSKKVSFIHLIIQIIIQIVLHVPQQYQHPMLVIGKLFIIEFIFFKIFSFSSLKIYALDFDIESISVTRLTSITRINDWLEINNNGEKLYGIRSPFTLLFDDVIEASLMFKSDLSNTKREYHGFLLYFIGKRIDQLIKMRFFFKCIF